MKSPVTLSENKYELNGAVVVDTQNCGLRMFAYVTTYSLVLQVKS